MNTWQDTRQPRPNVRKQPLDKHEEALIEEPDVVGPPEPISYTPLYWLAGLTALLGGLLIYSCGMVG